MNGYLRTPKIHKFNELIKWLNANSTNSETIGFKDVDNSSILENAWLSGFIEADGSFDIRVRGKSSDGAGKNRVEARLRIEQRKNDPVTGDSYASVLQSIAIALGVVLNISIHHGTAILYYYCN